jgi:hypothetical protein
MTVSGVLRTRHEPVGICGQKMLPNPDQLFMQQCQENGPFKFYASMVSVAKL